MLHFCTMTEITLLPNPHSYKETTICINDVFATVDRLTTQLRASHKQVVARSPLPHLQNSRLLPQNSFTNNTSLQATINTIILPVVIIILSSSSSFFVIFSLVTQSSWEEPRFRFPALGCLALSLGNVLGGFKEAAAAALSDDAGLHHGAPEALDDGIGRLRLPHEYLCVISALEPQQVREPQGGVMWGRRG